MGRFICRRCRDRLSLVDDYWIHLGLPIAEAWTFQVEPVEAGSADDPSSAGAPVPARPHPPQLSSGAAAALTFEGRTTDECGRHDRRRMAPRLSPPTIAILLSGDEPGGPTS